jgi:hypothetical protein
VRTTRVSSAAELLDARASADDIEVDGLVTGMPMITLRPGTTLRGGTLRFGAKGIRLSAGNTLADITILVPDHEVAISNDTGVADFGTLTLRKVHTRGQVLVLAEDEVRTGHVIVDGLTVVSADLRGRTRRQHAFGVDAMPGAFTVWNRQPDPASRITASLTGISAGAADSPVRGSGAYIAGRPGGGTVEVDVLRTGPVFADGGIEPGTPDLISGGVFVVSGARVDTVVNDGPVTTFGANDMVLDNWGEVGTWTARAPVTSHGPSAIGFVQFGVLGRLDVQAPITTHGAGARGFNVYDGRLGSARFRRIVTHGDGAIGIQISRDVPDVEIVEDVTTAGGLGASLVKGVQTPLRAIAVSIKPEGRIRTLTVGGSLRTGGDEVITLDVEGALESLTVRGGITATGTGSVAVRAAGNIAGLDEISVTAPHGLAMDSGENRGAAV